MRHRWKGLLGDGSIQVVASRASRPHIQMATATTLTLHPDANPREAK